MRDTPRLLLVAMLLLGDVQSAGAGQHPLLRMRVDETERRASFASSAGLTAGPRAVDSWVTAGHAVAGCGWIAGGSVRRRTLAVSETVEPDLARVVEGDGGSGPRTTREPAGRDRPAGDRSEHDPSEHDPSEHDPSEHRGVADPSAHREVGGSIAGSKPDAFERGRVGFAIGYPSGRLSALRVMANRPVRLEIHGRGGIIGSGYAEAWSILTPVFAGLGGISGGVVVDETGGVRGTVVALDARRGRLVVVPWPRAWIDAWRSAPFVFGAESDPLVVVRSAARRGHVMKLECRARATR